MDAHSGEVLAFQDLNQYALKKITGAVYPVSDDECCPDGCAVQNTGISYTDTGFASPNNYTSLNGLYDYASGAAITTLSGRYVDVVSYCGTIAETSATGDIDLSWNKWTA